MLKMGNLCYSKLYSCTAVPLSNEKQDLSCLKLCLLTIFKLSSWQNIHEFKISVHLIIGEHFFMKMELRGRFTLIVNQRLLPR